MLARTSATALILLLGSACSASPGPTTCGAGTLKSGDTCIAHPSCGAGTRIEAGLCVADPPPEVRCGLGTHRAGTSCAPNVWTSTTSTTSFGANVAVSEPELSAVFDPAMAVDSKGTIAIAAVAVTRIDTTGYEAGIALWRSTDGGKSFGRERTIGAGMGYAAADPALLYDSDDRLFIAWAEYGLDAMGNSIGDVMAAQVDGRGALSTPQLLDPMGKGDLRQRPWLSKALDGSVSIVWSAVTPATLEGGSKRAVARSGGAFDDLESISYGDFLSAPIAFDASGLGVGIGQFLSAWRRTDGGWSNVQVFSFGFTSSPFDPRITFSGRAGFTVAFVAPPSFALSLYALRSIDGGRSWDGPAPLAGSGAMKSSARAPSIAADESGLVHLMWLDNRSGGWLPYTAASEDGLRFRAEERIGDATFTSDGDPHRYSGTLTAFVARGGRRYAAWSDARNPGRSAIYFAAAPGVGP